MATDPANQPVDLEEARLEAYRRRVERRTGLLLEQVINLALEAEQRGASPTEVRAILDGDLSSVPPR